MLVMRAMMVKEFRELVRDRRTLAMLIVMPLLLLVIFGYAANFYVSSVKTAVVGPQASQVTKTLPSFFDVTVTEPAGTRADAQTLLRDNKADVAFVTGTTPVPVLVNGSNLFAAQSAVAALNKAGDQVKTQVLYNPGLKTSWVMVPAIIGLILTFIGTIITSIGMVRERESGTLEQLAVMPIRPSRVILGKIAPYFLVAALDMIIVTVLGIVLFSVPFNGNPFAFALGAAIFLFVVLGLGVFISTISQTVGQAIQTAFFFLLPQILLSGMIFPLEAMAAGVRWIGYLLPLTYFTMISQGIMLRGAPITSLWLPFVVLTAMAVVVFTGATLRFRRDLAPGRPASPADEQPAATETVGTAPSGGIPARSLRCWKEHRLRFAVHRPGSPVASPRSHGVPRRDVPGRVHVSVQRVPAGRAAEQGLALAAARCNMPARRAPLARVRGTDLLHPARGLVLQATDQQPPPGVQDAPVEPGLLLHVAAGGFSSPLGAGRHVLDLQILHADHVEPASQIGAGLLTPVRAPVALAGLQPGNGPLDPAAAARSSPGTGQLPLQLPHPLPLPRRQRRAAQQLPGRQGRGHDHAPVDADRLPIARRGNGFRDDRERHMPSPGPVPGHR